MFGLIKTAEEFKEDLTNKVYEYLKENYPPETLEWVKNADWSLKEQVPLKDIKMARRPGGAREMDKVKGIAQAVKEGKVMEPVVLVKLSDGSYKIADGYHRTLGFKYAEKDSIRAYVGKTEEDKGPWDKEMHEKKLNVGKKADEVFLGLTKLAKLSTVVDGAKRYVGGLIGSSKRKAQTELNHAKELQNLNSKHVAASGELKNDMLTHIPKQNRMNAETTMANHNSERINDTIAINKRVDDAEKGLRRAKRDQWVSRGATGAAVVGGYGVHGYNNPDKITGREILKTAAEKEKGLTDNQQLALGLAGVGAGAYAGNKALPMIDGMERLYHGTGSENAKNIREQGLLGAKAGSGAPSQRVDLAGKIGEENVANKVYATRSFPTAMNYASQNQMAGAGSDVVKMKIPYRDIQTGVVKEVANPELRGLNKKEFIQATKDEIFNNLRGEIGEDATKRFQENKLLNSALSGVTGAAYKSLDAPNTLTVEGDLPTQYIKGSADYKGQNLAGLIDYIKHNPGRFTKGVGLAGLGLGGVGLGVEQLRRVQEEKD